MATKLDKTNDIRGAEDNGVVGHEPRGWSRGMRLSDVDAGGPVAVMRIHGDEAFRGKMMGLGLVPGTRLQVLQGGGRRPLVIGLAGGRLLLDARSAELISVNRCPSKGSDSGVES
jgi:Fe2+ transport system protein FeoA